MRARLHGQRVEVSDAPVAPAPQVQVAPTQSPDEPRYVAPDRYGLRVAWQSEAEQVEAAEFMLATRAQEDARRRVMRMVDRLRSRSDDLG